MAKKEMDLIFKDLQGLDVFIVKAKYFKKSDNEKMKLLNSYRNWIFTEVQKIKNKVVKNEL